MRSRLQARRIGNQTGSTTPRRAALMSSRHLRSARLSRRPRPPVTPSISRPDEPMTAVARSMPRCRKATRSFRRRLAWPCTVCPMAQRWRRCMASPISPMAVPGIGRATVPAAFRTWSSRSRADLHPSPQQGVLRARHTRVMPRLPASPPSPSGAPGAAGSAEHPRRARGTHNPRDG